LTARESGASEWSGSLDLGISEDTALLSKDDWQWPGQAYPYPE
jgi:uncharacterized protein